MDVTADGPAEAAPTSEAGWAQRTRRVRLVILLGALGLTCLVWLADRQGFLAFLEAAPFTGRAELEGAPGHPVVIEQVDLLDPAARLVVARVPRGQGYRLRAVLADPSRQALRRVSEIAGDHGALVGINGDYHRLDGFCASTPYSTLIDQGQAATLGSPFSYACSFWLDAAGAPHVGRLDLEGALVRGEATLQPVYRNLTTGDALLIDRPPAGAWSSAPLRGVALTPTDDGGLSVAGPATQRFSAGPAFLAQPGSAAEAFLDTLAVGDRLTWTARGEHAQGVRLAIGTGPRLVEAGQISPALAASSDAGWTNRLARAAVGFDDEHVYLVTTIHSARGGLSLQDLAAALVALGCREAVNLDGGPSATLYAEGYVPLNVPTRTGGSEAEVGSALLVLPPSAGDQAGLR
jgi:Phosphodiester glycosidase